MKKIIFSFLALLFVNLNVWAQYESANKSPEVDYRKLEEQIGKKYWIKPNPNAILRKKFKEHPSASYSGEFVVTEELEFTVVGWELGSINTPNLKVQFQDGKIGYIEVLSWRENKNVLDNVFDGSNYYDFEEYIFKGKPGEILANWKNKKAKAQAEHKAKGGVRIGMSKEDVLKSNWGKPESVNKTTSASGVKEQWVYGGRNYLYFTNGILTGIQN